jgi:hypothetical protein
VRRRGFLAVLATLVAAPWVPRAEPFHGCRLPYPPDIPDDVWEMCVAPAIRDAMTQKTRLGSYQELAAIARRLDLR